MKNNKITIKTKYFDGRELDDKNILEAIAQAAKDYEDGAIAEAREALAEVVVSIDQFDKLYG